MKQISTLLVATFVCGFVSGQDKKDLTMTFSAGVLNSPYYKNARSEEFYGFDFNYYLSDRTILATSYFAGKHRYFDSELSNTNYGYSDDGTNAEARYNVFSLLVKYKVASTERFSVIPGVGVGIMTHTRNFPYRENNSESFHTSSWSDLAFPVSMELNYRLSKRWTAGLMGGFLIEPDFPIVALHAGPQLTYHLK